MFALRIPKKDLPKWSAAYNYKAVNTKTVDELRPGILERGYMSREVFLAVCKWKTPRSQPRCAQNDERTIEVLTRAAFASRDESIKMDLLRLLEGVEWPTASTLLHFGDKRQYPILDFRALWSLGYEKAPAYTMDFWLAYLDFTRATAASVGMTVRELDRALWQYSRENQVVARR